jgi:hypothetical protein
LRTGPRIVVACLIALAFACSPAYAADTLNVYTDNSEIALGAGTLVAAHAETDAGYGGGHVDFKYKPDADCAPSSAEDNGSDASGGAYAPVEVGPSTADVGGQMLQLGVGSWRICGWLVDDATGATVASGFAVVKVVPYKGSISLSIKRTGQLFQFAMAYSTSGPARLFATVQRTACPKSPSRIGRRARLLLPRGGRLVGSDGGLGRAIGVGQLAAGRWRVCSWLQADGGSVGPVSKTFSVPKQKPRGGHAAG